jgi:hypothetical protein
MRHILLIALLMSSCAHLTISQSDLEGFEDIDATSEEDFAFPRSSEESGEGVKEDGIPYSEDSLRPNNDTAASSTKSFTRGQPDATLKYTVEIISAAFCLIYVIAAFYGSSTNKRIAEAWTKSYAFKGGLFERNFSSVGSEKNVPLMRESGNLFKFYATGRRYCHGLLAELKLLPRQDLISMFWNLLSPTEDLVQVEVYMTGMAIISSYDTDFVLKLATFLKEEQCVWCISFKIVRAKKA